MAVNWPKLRLLEARCAWWLSKYRYRDAKYQQWIKAGNTAHDWQRKHLEQGRKDLAAINQKQIEEDRKEIAKWGTLRDAALHEVAKYRTAIAKLKPKPPPVPQGEGYSTPKTPWNPARREIANWIVRELTWAWEHGQGWYVTSGLRTYALQKILWERYQRGEGGIAARPGQSNHEGWNYQEHRGAVDVVPANRLNEILNRKSDRKLLWAETHGLSDYVHFSATGH